LHCGWDGAGHGGKTVSIVQPTGRWVIDSFNADVIGTALGQLVRQQAVPKFIRGIHRCQEVSTSVPQGYCRGKAGAETASQHPDGKVLPGGTLDGIIIHIARWADGCIHRLSQADGSGGLTAVVGIRLSTGGGWGGWLNGNIIHHPAKAGIVDIIQGIEMKSNADDLISICRKVHRKACQPAALEMIRHLPDGFILSVGG